MMDGHGDCGGHFVGGDTGGGDGGGGGIWVKPHEVQPLMTGLTVNGAPIIDQSHEFLIEKKESQE